jgi:hypothetical protein
MTVWPSGDVSIGYSHPPVTDKAAHPLEGIVKDAWGIAFVNRQLPDNGADLSVSQWLKLFDFFVNIKRHDLASACIEAADGTVDPENPLGLSVVSNSPNSQPERKIRRGLGGITTYQKRLTKSAGTILERQAGRGNLSFYTCTLPNICPDDLELIAQNWAKLTKSFCKELGRALERSGLPAMVVGVTEIQEKRLTRWGQICPHLHLVFQGRRNKFSAWAIDTNLATDLWNRQIELVIGKPFDGRATTRIEKPRKSMKAELGKYLTKGTNIINSIVEAGKIHLLPTCWVVCSLSLRRQVKREIRQFKNSAVENIFDRRSELQSIGVLRFRDILIQPDADPGGREFCIGCAGYFVIENWRELLKPSRDELDAWILGRIEQRVRFA